MLNATRAVLKGNPFVCFGPEPANGISEANGSYRCIEAVDLENLIRSSWHKATVPSYNLKQD